MILNKLKQENGSAILIGLIIMGMLTMIAIMSVDRSVTDIDLSYNKHHSEQALYLAEAGAESALGMLNLDDSWRDGYDQETLGKGVYSVQIIDSLTDSTLYDSMLIISTGWAHESTAEIELLVAPDYIRPFEFALFARNSIDLHMEACTDSYASDSGSYIDTRLDEMGNIGANGTIYTGQNTSIGGDASVPYPGILDFDEKTLLYGDSTSTGDSVVLDIVPDSEFDSAQTINHAESGGISGGGFDYDVSTNALTVIKDQTIILDEGTYYFSDILLERGANIALAAGAEVTIYVTGNMDLSQGSGINDGGAPSNLIIYSNGPSLTFHQDNVFNGGFYGPDSEVFYDQTTQVYGSLVGNNITIDKFACLHYDRSLFDYNRGKSGIVEAFAWKEVY